MQSDTYTPSNGRHLNYTYFKNETTTTPTLVFIHGLGSSQNFYYAIAKKLWNEGHQCLIFDNYGASLSPLSKEDEAMVASGEGLDAILLKSSMNDVLGLVQHLEIFSIVLVGHSMGAMIVNYIAGKLRDDPSMVYVEGAILLGPVHPGEGLIEVFDSRVATIQKEGNILAIANGVCENAVGRACSDLAKSFIRDLVMRQNVNGYIYNCKVISNASRESSKTNLFEREVYPNIPEIPIYILTGEDDKTAPWDTCVNVIVSGIKAYNSKLQVFKLGKVGHWPAVEDEPRVYTLIKNFMEVHKFA